MATDRTIKTEMSLRDAEAQGEYDALQDDAFDPDRFAGDEREAYVRAFRAMVVDMHGEDFLAAEYPGLKDDE